MDIHILRDSIEIGPFPEETVQTLLKQGSVSITDLAWRPGMPQWVPLVNLLYPSATPPPPPGSIPPPPPPVPSAAVRPELPQAVPAPPSEPATARQKAFLTYVGIHFSTDLSKEAAALLVNDAMENPRDPARLAKWNDDRLRLHPELFATEIHAKKEGRSQRFLEICEHEGAAFFTKVTKAHCQVLVGYLDVKFPHWDADERTAASSYFFPAVAEKFPQLLTKAAKGQFKYGTGPKLSADLAHRASPVTVKAKPSSGPVVALVRGVFFGVIILAMLWFVKNLMDSSVKKPTTTATAPAATPVPNPAPLVDPAASAPVEPAAAPAENPAATVAATAPAGAEMAVNANPLTPASEPATSTSLFNDPPAGANTVVPTVPADPATGVPPRTALLLTKPVEIDAKYGKIKLPPGTPVKLLQQNGSVLTIQYLNNTVTVPSSSTDLNSPPAAVPPPAVAPSVAPAPATPTTAATPASDL